MSTYQDRAREIVQAAINFAVAEATRKQKTLVDNYPQVSLEGALSELASIVEEEKQLAQIELMATVLNELGGELILKRSSLVTLDKNTAVETWDDMDGIHYRLREQRDQLSNRNLPTSDEDNKETIQ